jgi:hypothetical protein
MTTIFRHRNESEYDAEYDDDDDEEFSSHTSKIDDSIFKDCRKSKLKIIYMPNEELKKKKSFNHHNHNFLNNRNDQK